ncbi:EamA family transporter [Rhodobacterales bacterium LSUCC0031]|nr:EamA family transporter [Rhodobacterales bacterium LSUCC0031]
MDNLKGMAWMTLAMLAFALTDMFMVFAAREMPVWQILFLFGTGGAILFGLWARAQGHAWFGPALVMRPVILRNLAEVFATVCFVIALSRIPLSTLSAVIQANPLLVTLGAALFLGEKVGWRRWLAIGVGLCGVLLILRPGAESFDPDILFAVGAAIGLSMRDLATRPVPKSVPTPLLASYSFAALAVAGGGVLFVVGGWVWPTPMIGLSIPAAILLGMVAYFAITAAMRVGEIAAVTPFRYTRLVFAFFIAMVVFGESIDATTVAGVAIVIATGLYSLWRERQARLAR